jgi:hypothetical protein
MKPEAPMLGKVKSALMKVFTCFSAHDASANIFEKLLVDFVSFEPETQCG